MNVLRTARGPVAAIAFVPVVLLLAGCSNKPGEYKPAAAAEVSNYKITGKVTHQGQAVPYGYVLFYGQSGIDAKTGRSAPPIVAKIEGDGRYEIASAVIGPNSVCVVTDP